MQGATRKKKYEWFFRGAPRISKINELCTCNLSKQWQITIKQLELGHYTFSKCDIQVLLESTITDPYIEHLKPFLKMTFTHSLWVNSGKSQQKQLELGHCTLKLLYARCPTYGAPFAKHLKFHEKLNFTHQFE